MTPWPLRLLRWAYVAFIAVAGANALQHALHGEGEGHHSAGLVLVLAGAELAGALAFLVEPLEVVACAVLLVVYIAAGIISATSADFVAPVRLLYFAAAVFIVFAHRRSARAAPAAS
jgi:hypothetical protein